MKRVFAAYLAASLFFQLLLPPARAVAQPAGPFPIVPFEAPVRRSHAWAYVTLAGGAGLIGVSFAFERRADRAYDAYLTSTDPHEIDKLYDRTVLNDRLSQASVLCGEALIAAGIYLRFIRHPAGSSLSLDLRPGQCGVSLRF